MRAVARSVRTLQSLGAASARARAPLMGVRALTVRADPVADMFDASTGDLAASHKAQVLEQDKKNLETRLESNPDAKHDDPPLTTFAPGYKYATLLYRAAYSEEPSENAIFRVYFDLDRLLKAMDTDATFGEVMENKVGVSNQEMVDFVDTDDSVSGLGLSDEAHTLLAVLANEGKMNQLRGVIGVYRDLIHHKLGIVTARVTMASADEEALTDVIESIDNTFLAEGQRLRVEVDTDDQLIAGFSVSINNEDFYDYSSEAVLSDLEQRMRSASA